jgi:glutamyl-tRNA reductase
MIGLDYKTAPVEIREKLTFSPTELPKAMVQLSEKKSILENIIISTCNRTEIYAVVDQLHTGRFYIKSFLSEWFDLDKEQFVPYLNILSGEEAAEHLFKVSTGLDSMILGETQILGQIRTGFLTGQQEGTIGTVFNMLFKQSITFAKRAHSETQINENAVSISYAAVELSKKIFGNLSKCHVMIFGAGKMGDLALQNLRGHGVEKITVVNRTFEKAVAVAEKFAGTARPIEELEKAMIEADIIISSTGAKDFVITKPMMARVERVRHGKPLFMIDIAVPRDIAPEVSELQDIFLYDIDDLAGIVEANLEERKKEAVKIEKMIVNELAVFFEWLNMLGVVPIISVLRDKALKVQTETMVSIERKMPNLTDREKKLLNKHTKSIINQILRDPILTVKELAGSDNSAETIELFMKIFNIKEDVEIEKSKKPSLVVANEEQVEDHISFKAVEVTAK